MENYLLLIFSLLLISLISYLIPKSKLDFLKKLFRNFIIISAIFYFIIWIFSSSKHTNNEDKNTIKIINKTPQNIDIYLFEKTKDTTIQAISHIGKIRPEHYILEKLEHKSINPYWIAGYLSKNELIYFSELNPQKNEITIENYSIDDKDFSKKVDGKILKYKQEKNQKSIFITLSFLLIFIHIVLYIKNKKK